jgi:hypothetical protein
MAKKLVYDYTFTPSTNTIVLSGNVSKKRLLLITNVTDNIIIFNFADVNRKASSFTYDNDAGETLIVLEYDCSEMSSTDTLQIFVEEDAVEFKPTPTYTDPVSKFRISQAQTLIDTDFEYGLQATKWETLEMVNNIPGFYSRSGDTPLSIISVTAILGQKNLTVFSPNHGLSRGTPIDVRGLNQSNLDGSYLITSVPDGDSFVFQGRIESNFTGSLSGAYTSITPGKFYASSDVEFSSINTDGGDPAEITVTTPFPNGFREGNEFYIVNSIATTNINFDSTAIDPINTLSFVNTVNPTAVGTRNSPDQLAVNIYDFRSTLGNVYIDTTQVSSTTITATAHGLSNLDAVAWVQVSGVKPTAVTDQSFYHARVLNANQFEISTSTATALINVVTGFTGIATILKGYRVVSFASSTDRFALNVAMGASNQQPHMLLSSAANGTGIVGGQSLTKSVGSRLWDGSATGLGTANGTSWGSLAFNLQVSTTSVQFGFNGTTAYNGTTNALAAQTGFVPVADSVNTNTILDSSHGLTSNEIVTYNNGGGTVISGLTNNTSYYVDLIDTNRFGLKATTAGARINLTGYGATGTNHTFTSVRTNPTKNTIFVASHGLPNGSQLLYDINGGTSIGGLTDLATYYVIDASTDRFRLSEVVGGAEVDLTTVGVGTQVLTIQSEGSFDGVYAIDAVNSPTEFTLSNTLEIPKTTRGFDPSTDLNTGTDTFTINSHRYTTGTPVEYDNGGGSDVGGLTTGETYYVIRVTSSTFKLAATYVDAIAGTKIDITSAGSGTTHRFISANIAGELPGQGTVEIVSGSKVVLGTNTRFASKYKVGDVILIDTGTSIFESTITAISSNTELTILDDAPSSASGLTYLSLTGFYVKSNAFSIHRPFDGGVEINAGYAPLTQIIRQTRRYFRYQSGKGLNCQVAINFNPGLEIMNLTVDFTEKVKCRRDIGYILDGVGYDVALGTNYNARFLGFAEVNSLETDWFVVRTIEKSEVEVLALSAVSSSATATSRVGAFYDEIYNIIGLGRSSASPITFTNPTTATVEQIAAKDKILANIDFITAEINAWVDLNFAPTDHDVDKCTRDLKYALWALCYDILYGGNSTTYDQARFFLYGYADGDFGIIPEHINQTVAAYERLSEIIGDIVTGTAVTKTTTGGLPNTETQVTSGNNASSTEVDDLTGLVQITIDTIRNGDVPSVTVTYPDIAWADDALEAVVAAVASAKTTILNTVVTATGATAQTRFRHGMQVGTRVTVRDAEVSTGNNSFNGTFTIRKVTDNTFEYEISQEPAVSTASGFPFAVVRDWNGALLKTGMFDDQNGMFWEYDGSDLYCVRRNSTKQIAGTASVTYRSSLVVGTDTRFAEQLAVGDKVVIRGQSYRIINIPNSTTMYISPPYKGVAAENVVVCKTINLRTPQEEWSVDVCDGTGSNGYVLDVTKIQMAYIDYSWYGAGKVRYGFKDANGEVTYVHEYKHNNLEDEAYMRSGNLPARYECENIGIPSFAPSLAHWGTTIQMDGGFDEDNAYLFTASSNFLTFTGTSATVTGTTNNYIYVNPNGSTVTVVNTYSVTANISTSNVTTSSGGIIQNRNTISLTNHGFTTGQIVQYDDAGGIAITGLTDLAFYYIIRIDANRFALALTDAGARAGTRVVLTGQGNNNQRFRFSFRFGVTPTNIPGYGQRIVHRFVTNTSGYALIGNVSFGTPISSTAIDAYGSARIFKVTDAGSGQGTVDFFYSVEPVNLTFPQFPSLATNGFIPSSTSAAIAHIVGQATPVPAVIPIVSVRLGPSVDSGLIGPIGSRDIVNRMQLDLDSVGLLTTHDVEIQLILNGQLDNVNWANVGRPSLSQVVGHLDGDNIEGGTTIFTFRASGNSPDSAGKRTARNESFDISSILSLGNSILGGDNVFPDGPDILTIAVSPLDTSTITVNTPMSISGRISWAESQA